ncbi:MAG: shikimate kinase [bacterium]|nr:shikimate kinase [bacterium]
MGKNIVLVGLMGAGKTSVGKLLSKKYKLKCVDVDEFMEFSLGMTISEVFSQYGESSFRELEKDAIKVLSQKTDNIISTGGGALENEENIRNLQRNGVLVYLKTSPETLYERVKNQKHRPLLQNENPLGTLENLLNKRENAYMKADFVVETDGKSLENVAKEIGELCKL